MEVQHSRTVANQRDRSHDVDFGGEKLDKPMLSWGRYLSPFALNYIANVAKIKWQNPSQIGSKTVADVKLI